MGLFRRSRKIWKRVTAFTLSVLIGVGSISTGVSADSLDGDGRSNDIISTFINLANGQSETDLSGTAMTEDQLRFLGVYASNFFVPYVTEFGAAASDGSNASVDQMAQALQTGLKYSETYAKSFAETLIGLAKGSVKDLQIAFSDSYQENYVVPESDDLTLRNTYWNFLSTMIGGGEQLMSDGADRADYVYTRDETQEAGKKDAQDRAKMKYGYWGYMSSGGFVPVADFYMDRNDGMTAFQLAFLTCLKDADWTKGYGWSVYDLITSETDNGDLPDDLAAEDYAKVSIFGSTVKVDCFGDLISCSSQHQAVVVPGCVNPYVWVAVDASGTDLLKPGEAYNAINIRTMSALDDGKFGATFSTASENTTVDGDGNVVQTGTTLDTFKTYTVLTEDTTKEYFDKLNNSATPDVVREQDKTTLRDALESAAKEDGGTFEVSFEYDQENTVDTEGKLYYVTGLKITASVRAWRSLMIRFFDPSYNKSDPQKLADYYSISVDEVNSIGNKADGALSLLYVDIYNEWSESTVTTAFYKKIANIYSTLVRQEFKDAPDEEETGRTNTLLKNLRLVADYQTSFLKMLDSQADDPGTKNNNAYLKRFKGSTSIDLDNNWVPGQSDNTKTKLGGLLEWLFEQYPYDVGPVNSDYIGVSGSLNSAAFMDKLDIDIGGTFPQQSLHISDGMIVIDQLGAFTGATASSEYHTFPATNYITSDSGETINNSGYLSEEAKWNYGEEGLWSAGFSVAVKGEIVPPTGVSDTALVSLYTTYLISSLYEDGQAAKSETIGRTGFRMNNTGLPAIPSEPLELSNEAKADIMLTSIRDWLYYLLHPIEGFNYVRELLTNKINAFLLGWHNDMLGTNGVGQTTGTTLYRSNTGYVTTPDLSEIEWTNSLINFYNECIPFLLVVMIVTMVFAYITGILSLQKSIFGVVIFAIFLLLPVNLINGVVNFSNRISENIYGEKFTYWALIQQETYSTAIDTAAQQDSYQNYLQTLYQTNNAVYNNQGSESIVLKWQAPKKMTSIMISNDDTYSSLTSGGQQLLNQFLGNSFSGESFVDDPESVYLYRSYLDISNFSRYVYNGIKDGTVSSTANLTNDITYSWDGDLIGRVATMSSDYLADRNNGYANPNDAGAELNTGIKLTVPMSSKIYSDAIDKTGTVKSLTINDYVGINQNAFNLGIPLFNKGKGSDSIIDILQTNATNATEEEKNDLKNNYSSYTDSDWSGLAAYALYSENVFYYFSWNLYDMGIEPSSSINTGYKDLLLGSENAGFFYNTMSNGELKDFMDMKSLFTYIIPYLRMGNQLVHEWDDVYGLFIYDGVPTEEGHWSDPDISGNVEMQQKYWHNLNVARLYGIYTPWVDIMYDCSYSDGEYINALGKRYFVEDPIDPASYPAERPMIFSESEMHEYGLDEGDLTAVERLILDCNRGMEERMYELLNYYNFSDVTLNTAAAMNCAFEFNNTFSENGIFSENHNIYPQSFELADFSYDAFLRFILSNTTGEVMNTTEDFYQNIVDNSSMTTVLVMLILDVLSMYVLPAFKIFFLIAVFLSALLIIVTTAFRVDPEQKFIKRLCAGVLIPMIKFMAITIGFAYVISLFMGTGNNAVTQTHEISIQMGDPVVVMLAMCAVDIIVLILYFKVIKKVVQDMKRNGKMAVNFMGGVFGGAASMVAGAVGGAVVGGAMANRGGSSGGSGGSGGRRRASDEQEGTGVENERAKRRGSHDVDDASDMEESTRKNDTKRDAVRPDNTPKSRDKEKEKKDNLNEKTKSGMNKLNRSDADSGKSKDDFGKSGDDSGRQRRSSDMDRYTKSIKDPGSNSSKNMD